MSIAFSNRFCMQISKIQCVGELVCICITFWSHWFFGMEDSKPCVVEHLCFPWVSPNLQDTHLEKSKYKSFITYMFQLVLVHLFLIPYLSLNPSSSRTGWTMYETYVMLFLLISGIRRMWSNLSKWARFVCMWHHNGLGSYTRAACMGRSLLCSRTR